MRGQQSTILFAIVFLSFVLACKKRDRSPLIPTEPPEHGEVITTVQVVFRDSLTGNSKLYYFADPDGPGGKPAFYGPGDGTQADSVIALAPGTVYNVQLLLLNESVEPADTVSKEIVEEGEEHLVFYDNGSSLPLSGLNQAMVTLAGGTEITYSDADLHQNSIGLLSRWKTGSGNHLLRITLKHQHDGKDVNVLSGDTDLEVFFNLSLD